MSITEETTRQPAEVAGDEERTEAPRCRYGSKSENPCWRAAIERRPAEDEEPSLCREHAHFVRLGEDEDAWHYTLDEIEVWFRKVAEDNESGHLEVLAWNLLDAAREGYARAATKALAAKIAADVGPPEDKGEPQLAIKLAISESEELARRMIRADSFNDVRTLIEDAPDEVLKQRNRWALVDTLIVAAVEAEAEVERYKQELGLA